MKELTTEQKARAYDEAIRKAAALYKASEPMSGCNVIIETLFPELAESEDERIRKILFEFFKNYKEQDTCGSETFNGIPTDNILAWLEKQGTSYTKKDVDDVYLKGVTDTKKELEKQYEANYQIRKDIATFIFNYRGDIKDRAKWMDYLGIKVSFVEGQGEQKLADSYCQENCKGFQETGKCFADGECKAKREALSMEIPFGSYDSELQEATYYIPKGFHSEIEGDKIVIKRGEQESAEWDREDEQNLNACLGYIPDEFLRRWLTDIIHVKYDKPAWSDDDKKVLNQIISIIEDADEDLIRPENMSIYTNWLKSLKDKAQPQNLTVTDEELAQAKKKCL